MFCRKKLSPGYRTLMSYVYLSWLESFSSRILASDSSEIGPCQTTSRLLIAWMCSASGRQRTNRNSALERMLSVSPTGSPKRLNFKETSGLSVFVPFVLKVLSLAFWLKAYTIMDVFDRLKHPFPSMQCPFLNVVFLYSIELKGGLGCLPGKNVCCSVCISKNEGKVMSSPPVMVVQ